MNPWHNFELVLNAIEKLDSLTDREILENADLRDGIKNVLTAQNIDGILAAMVRDLKDSMGERKIKAVKHSEQQLLNAYARMQHEQVRATAKDAKTYFTELVCGDIEQKATAANSKTDDLVKAEQAVMTAYNGIYSRGALEIGTENDPTRLLSYLDYTPYRQNYIDYLSVPTLAELVDRPIDLALKKFPKIKSSKSEKFGELAESFFNRVEMRSVRRDAIFAAALSARGSLMVPILEDNSVFFNVFNDTQFAYGLSSGHSKINAKYTQTRVGNIYCLGAELTHGKTAWFTCDKFEPLLGIGYNRVPMLKVAADAWNLYVSVLKILLIRSQVLVESMEGDMQTDTMLQNARARFQRLSKTLGVSTPLAQPRGMKLDILNNNIGPGTADIASVFKEFIASVTGVSPEYFFGGGNSNYSQAAFQIASTNENLRARYQIAQDEPLLRFALNTAIAYDKEFKNCGVGRNEFEIVYESIYDETEQEKADLTAKKTETLIRQRSYSELEKAFKQEGLLSPDVSLSKFEPDHDGDDESGDVDDKGEKSTLTKPMT